MLLRSVILCAVSLFLAFFPPARTLARGEDAPLSAAAAGPVVTAIGVVTSRSGPQITISADADLAYEYYVIEGRSLVIDLPGATSKVWPAEQQVGDAFVSRVRVAEQTGEKAGVRIVFDLLEQAPFAIEPGRHQLSVSFAAPVREEYTPSSSRAQGALQAQAAVSPQGVVRGEAAPSLPARRAPTRPSNRVSDVTVQFLSNAFHVKISTAAKPVFKRLPGRGGTNLAIAVVDADMAAPFPRETDYTYLNSAIRSVSAWPESGSVIIGIDLFRDIPEPRIIETEQGLEIVIDVLDSARIPNTQAAPPPPSFLEMPAVSPLLPEEVRTYSKCLISLTFQDADITEIFSVISTAPCVQTNIITWDGVKGKRSVSLDNVPWDQALDLLCKTHTPNLVQIRESEKVIRISTYEQFLKDQSTVANKKAEIERERAKAEQEKANADSANARAEQAKNETIEAQIKRDELRRVQEREEKMRSARLERRTFRVSYGDVEAIGKRIAAYSNTTGDSTADAQSPSKVRPVSFARNDIIFEVNKDSKTIFVQDFAENVALMALIVSALDLPTPAVMVEARIVEVFNNAEMSMGIQWGAPYSADAAHGNATQYAFPNSISIDGGVTQGTSGLNPGTYMVNLPASGSVAGVGLTLGHIANTFSLDMKLSAMESLGKTKILSNPKILVLQNNEAKINIGRRLPMPRTSSEGDVTVEWLDVGILLKVTPEITNDGKVIMQVTIEKSEVGEAVSTTQGQMYSLASSRAETRVIVGDGETSVIGGLFIQTKLEDSSSVPGLSKLPFLGWLFKSKSTSDDRSELMIFITPKLVSASSESPHAAPPEAAN